MLHPLHANVTVFHPDDRRSQINGHPGRPRAADLDAGHHPRRARRLDLGGGLGVPRQPGMTKQKKSRAAGQNGWTDGWTATETDLWVDGAERETGVRRCFGARRWMHTISPRVPIQFFLSPPGPVRYGAPFHGGTMCAPLVQTPALYHPRSSFFYLITPLRP